MAEEKPKQSYRHPDPKEPEGRVWIEGMQTFRSGCQRMAQLATSQLDIFTRDLDAALFDQQPFLEALKILAIRGRLCPVRILLQDNHRVQQNGHRLVDLARRLPSSIQIRRPHPDHIDHQENFLVVDGTGYMKWNPEYRYQGHVDYSNLHEGRRLSSFFIMVWECSEPDSDLRRLTI